MKNWNDKICDAPIERMITDTLPKAQKLGSAWGEWCMDTKELDMWMDANSLAVGVALDAKGAIIEDACWLRPIKNIQDINVAELDAVLRGVNLALSGGPQYYT